LRKRLSDQADEIQSFKERPPSTGRQQLPTKKGGERSRLDNSKIETSVERKNTQPKPGSSSKINHTERLRLERERKKKD
jgi:hypothetical protein